MNASSTVTRTARHALLTGARLYLCTDSCTSCDDLCEFLHVCYEGGTNIIQLHDKGVDTHDETAVAEALAEVAAEHGKLFTVNDRADIAALTDADTLHVGQEDLTTEQAHQIVGPEVLVDRSNRNLDMFAASLAGGGIDCAVIGPVHTTPTRPDRQPIGVDMIHGVATLVRRVHVQGSTESHQGSMADVVRLHDRNASGPVKPWWAIGGTNAKTVDEIVGADVERITVVRALTEMASPEEVARTLRAAVMGVDGINSHDNK